MEEGMIPGNLHFKEANPNITALKEGRMKIVSENTQFTGGVVAINNFGFGGSNAHLVLRSHVKPKYEETGKRTVPRLVLSCGRTDYSVRHILQTVYEKNFSDEAIVLLEEASKTSPQKMKYRGYGLLPSTDKEDGNRYCLQECSGESRPLWFLYSGMGSQWSTMARDMMRLEPFEKSIKESAEILKPFGVDLLHMLTKASDEELNHIVAPFVTIAAVQIAITDLLKQMGLEPEGIVGHSVGELGCAYADGCFTARQMILAAYWRGKSCDMAELIKGKMAAIGMTWDEAKQRCPKGVFPVCENAEDSVTISGPAAEVQAFVQQLKAEGVFAREVKSGNIAFHSMYVEPAAKIMRQELLKLCPVPVARSSRWISSSVSQDKWDTMDARFSSADYHINNLLSPVLFKDAMSHVPSNALIIEIAPHSLLRPIVMRILGQDSLYIGLMDRREKDNLQHFLKSVGSLYNAGLNPAVRNLYKPVTFPVPRGTPMLGSLIVWDKEIKCATWDFEKQRRKKDEVTINTYKGSEYEFILDHKVDGRVLFPATGYLWLVWKALARHNLWKTKDIPVVFEDVRFLMASVPSKSGIFQFHVRIMDGATGTFNIYESGSLLVSGTFRKDEDTQEGKCHSTITSALQRLEDKDEVFHLDAYCFYKELRLRGYEYGKAFQGVTQAQSNGLKGKIRWDGNWVSFMDSMLQIGFLVHPYRMFMLPTKLRKVRIDPSKMPKTIGEELEATFNPWTNHLVCGPVEVEGFHCTIAPRKPLRDGRLVLENHCFIPYFSENAFSNEEELKVEEYISVSATLAQKALSYTRQIALCQSVLNGYKEASDELIKKYLNCGQKDHVLIQVFQRIISDSNTCLTDMKNSGDSVNNVIKKPLSLTETKDYSLLLGEYDLRNDLVTRLSISEKLLKKTLDIVLDNITRSVTKILEISNHDVVQGEVEKAMILTHNGLLFNSYIVARTNEKPIPENLLYRSSFSDVNIIQVKPSKLELPNDVDLIIAKDIFSSHALSLTSHLKTLTASLKENGFIFLTERTTLTPAEKVLHTLTGTSMGCQKEYVLEDVFSKEGLTVISKEKDRGTFVLYLLRKISRDIALEPKVFHLQEKNDYLWVEELKHVLEENETEKRKVWVVAENSESGIIGLLNSIRLERFTTDIKFFFNASLPGDDECPGFDLRDPFIRKLVEKGLRSNVYRGNCWGYFGNRCLPAEPEKVQSYSSYLNTSDRGTLSDMKWTESPIKFWKPTEKPTEVKVHVFYSALNFRDVMIASGKLHFITIQEILFDPDCRIGYEFAGVEAETGRRVMGIIPSRGLASTVVCTKEMLFDVPSNWTLEEASTVPMVYLTAYYALIVRARLDGSETVLVHAGSGGVGQAAIAICLDLGCRVYTTVGSEEKKKYLLNRFSGLDPDDVYNSRTLEFEKDILDKTCGEGVDIVLNSLAEEKLQASVRCLRTNGKFLEIGKYDMFMDNPLGLSHFNKNIEFYGIALNTLTEKRYVKIFAPIVKLMMDGIKSGVVKPLKTNVFPWEKSEDAFRFLASGKHIGKVIIKIRNEGNKNGVTRLVEQAIPSVPRTFFYPGKSVVVTGGLGGFGFELCHWLIDKGVQHLVISSRSGVKNSYQKFWIQKWIVRGVQVEISNDNIMDNNGCRRLLSRAKEMAPVGSIFHLAMVLHDGLFSILKPEDFQEVCGPKVDSLKNMDELSRELCPQLDNFCAFSSIVANKGSPGLSNYSYANSVMERIMERRRAEGLTGQAIQWGAIDDVGVMYEDYKHKFNSPLNMKGLISQTVTSCLSTLDRLMRENLPVVLSFVISDTVGSGTDIRQDLVSQLYSVLGITKQESLSPESTLGSLGMDSMMMVEAKHILETEYDVSLSAPDILKLTVAQLKEIESKKRERSTLAKLSDLSAILKADGAIQGNDSTEEMKIENLAKESDLKGQVTSTGKERNGNIITRGITMRG